MSLNFIALVGLCMAIMFVVFFLFFAIRAMVAYHNFSNSKFNIIFGSIIAGGGTGILLGIMLACVLPTYQYLTEDQDHHTHYVYNEHFAEQYGRKYLVNESSKTYYVVSMEYGNASVSESERVMPIAAKSQMEIDFSIDGWFKPFPGQISSKSKGEVKQYVQTEGQMKKELELIQQAQ